MNILLFEIGVIALVIILFSYMVSKGYQHVFRKFVLLFIGVLLFEIMSEPMWQNMGFDSWAYLYRDVTWILTLGWVFIFMFSIIVVDYAFSHYSEKKRFWLYLLFIEGITVPIETILLESGIRGYSELLLQSMSGFAIPFTSVPLEAVYAVPLFSALIIGFYKYTNYLTEHGTKR